MHKKVPMLASDARWCSCPRVCEGYVKAKQAYHGHWSSYQIPDKRVEIITQYYAL
jgi:hypothetical protein